MRKQKKQTKQQQLKEWHLSKISGGRAAEKSKEATAVKPGKEKAQAVKRNVESRFVKKPTSSDRGKW